MAIHEDAAERADSYEQWVRAVLDPRLQAYREK